MTCSRNIAWLAILACALVVGSCRPPKSGSGDNKCPPTAPAAKAPPPTAADAEKFVAGVNRDLMKVWVRQERMRWVLATYLTHDTNLLSSQMDEEVMELVGRKASEATRFDGLKLKPAIRRQLKLLKLAQVLPAPANAKERAALALATTKMKSLYGKGKYCSAKPIAPFGKKCLSLPEMYKVMAKNRSYDELLEVWRGWRKVSLPMRKLFDEYVRLGNKGARTLGFGNLADLWRSKYDMSPAAFEKETDRLWKQVAPLYKQLHCYVRAKLAAKYGKDKVPPTGPIPAHLLGNMWAQEWNNLFDLVAPQKGGAVNLEKSLKARKTDPKGMVRYAESFFVSLGLPKLPKTFWERSMFTKPRDRDVVCHASAWDLDWKDDLRIKMCIDITGEDFVTIHHELGHNYYQRAYNKLPTLFQDSANDGFHEALGDVIALSVTPKYLLKVGLLKKLPPDNLNPLMQRALEKIAFLPFGLLVDKWRWAVFSGRVKPNGYNKAWWALREKYQGVAPPKPRGEDHFDPGAKYHVPGNVPYTRYFLAAILQFQFHRALCKIAGQKGPLHKCSIFGSKAAGKRLNDMMKMGMSKPWPEALKALTGTTKIDARAILDYFKPLYEWLKKQNRGRKCGW